MVEEVCKCCGQTLPLKFSVPWRMKQSVMDLIEHIYAAGEHGISTERLFLKLYGHDPDGGPNDGAKVLHVRISQINKKLRQHGWEIANRMNTGTAGIYGRYSLKKLVLSPEETADVVERALHV